MGWFDGNPAHLWQHPPEAAAAATSRSWAASTPRSPRPSEYVDDGDLRFAAELASHAVFAEPDTRRQGAARRGLERLGYGAENGTWRNFYLTGAKELARARLVTADVSSAGMASALTVNQLFDSLAIRIDGPRAWDRPRRSAGTSPTAARVPDGAVQRRSHLHSRHSAETPT